MSNALQITLTLWEGPCELCDVPVAFSTFPQADQQIAAWDRASNFSEAGKRIPGYSKSNVKITGLPIIGAYEFRFDIGCPSDGTELFPRLLSGMKMMLDSPYVGAEKKPDLALCLTILKGLVTLK